MKQYYDYDHARARLSGTVVKLDDEFSYIGAVAPGGSRGEFAISYTPLGSTKNALGYIPKQQVSTDDLNLGFTMVPGYGSMYLSRRPTRMWKDGLAQGNVMITHPSSRTFFNRLISSIIASKYLKDTLLNKYPEYDEARGIAKEMGIPVAFSRHFAVDDEENLLFKALGSVGIAGKSPKLKNKYEFLKEMIEEELH